MIERNEYLDVLRRFKDKDLIKVITGIKWCGKSTLFEIYKEYLLENGVDNSQIISINLEDLKYSFIENYMDLYNHSAHCDYYLLIGLIIHRKHQK